MGVDFRDVDGTVTKHFLDVADIHIGFYEAGGEGVAEHMRSDVHINGCKAAVFPDGSADVLVGERTSCLVDEEAVGTLNIMKVTFPVFQQSVDNIVIANLEEPLFGTFAEDKQSPVGKVDVIRCDGAQLRDSDTGGKEQLDNSSIPERIFTLEIGSGVGVLVIDRR